MDDEIPLPPPPKIRHRSPAMPSNLKSNSPFQKPARPSRSSTRFDDLSSLPSSDPALFSSDDIPASSLENYNALGTSATRKRRYRGTWWGEMARDARKKRVDFKEKRHIDSGVWMGSDESSEFALSMSEDVSLSREEFLRTTNGPSTSEGPANVLLTGDDARAIDPEDKCYPRYGQLYRPRAILEPKEHELARSIVNDCLEKGQDSIDLSGSGLGSIPSGLLQPLLHLTRQPAAMRPPFIDNLYAPLEPFLRLFLSGNALTELSSELFELTNLKVLSLRNNSLKELPSAIRKLTALQQINVSVNSLQYLPWEILWLIKNGELTHLTVHPNPLLPLEEANVEWRYKDGTPPNKAWVPIQVAISPVQRFNMEGLPVADTKVRGVLEVSSETVSRVPSLRDLALLECNRFPYLDQFLDSDLSDYPELVVRLLKRAREIRNAGDRCCSVCNRKFVVARTEWIEWWDCTTYENGLKRPRTPGEKLRPLPFFRRGCSWACIPSREIVEHSWTLIPNGFDFLT
ncbi:hypothetical protein V8E54_013043 [Elaphomyces granulatus]